MTIAIILAGLVGLVIGWGLCYFLNVRDIEHRYTELVDTMIDMKKRGFVPQYDFDVQKEFDPSEEIREY